ncbi:MAG: protein translocase subunit SecD [Gemmatimonadota bacterium]
MFDSLRARLIVIGVLILGSVWSLWPRDITIRVRGADGRMRDTTVERVPIKLGLDLRGGMHLGLEIDRAKVTAGTPSDALDRALRVIRTRIDEFGVAEPLVQKVGLDRIVVELPGVTDPGRAKQIALRTAFLQFQMTDKQGLFRNALPGIDRALSAAGVTERSITSGVSDTTAQRPAGPSSAVEDILGGAARPQGAAGADTAKAQAPADTSRADTLGNQLGQGPLSPLLFAGSLPGEYLVSEEKVAIVDRMLSRPEAQRLLPRGFVLRWGAEAMSRGARAYRGLYILEERPIMTGEFLVDAKARLDPLYNQATVDFELTRRGGRVFERETGRHVGDHMAIVLDNVVQSQPPVIRSQIASRGQIELGSASLQEAQDLALVLKAGALPAPLQVVEERTVGPSMGADSIQKGIVAGIVGIALVVLLVIGYYRFSGVIAVLALILYVLFTFAGLAALGATLTLPGIAGFALSITIAVDANVLIFERIREELAVGKSLRLAVDAGFKMAMNAIVDSNVSMVLTAAFLFWFGTGPVKGFAVTLILGVLASMITAIFVVRTFFMVYLQRRPGLQTLSI